tara:strand:+ start:48 stop:473 length:426 start_codon:yes stop_codon:yes gene_type:complete
MPRRKPRRVRPREKNIPKGYDSMWEHSLHKELLQNWQLRGDKIKYIIEKTYEIDFVRQVGSKLILLEVKGRFWDHAEYSKYIWLRKALPKNTELVFLFQKPNAPMPGAKKRKSGTKRSHAEWADKNNFRWFSEETLPKSWR